MNTSMQNLRDIFHRVTSHRIFLPAVIAAVALIIGMLLAFELTRNIIKVRGPYLMVLLAIIITPIFAFRFFDPHEDARPIGIYFVVVSLYFILLGSPDFVVFLRMLLVERLAPGAIKHLILGITAFAGLAGGLHYALKLWLPAEEPQGRFLSVSPFKFAVYAVLQIFYLNLAVAIARERFGITTIFG